ncbi:MAG: CDP-glucose 4,6-dehydratase [Myxococcaceae bacterium]
MGKAEAMTPWSSLSGKRVLLTGHTGFKGAWLSLWLERIGAKVTGFALPPDQREGIFTAASVQKSAEHVEGDVRSLDSVKKAFDASKPDVVFHLAAQSLVRLSYDKPLETLETNVTGTANVLEAVRASGKPCAIVIVTSDKCYENREWMYAYRENDAMGGHDVYSMSKGAAELVTSSWRRSFFHPDKIGQHGVKLASARAGNVIGGGDWAKDRIVPDAISALRHGKAIGVRNPDAVRPWQHVLEPLSGYLTLAARLLEKDAARYCDAFNFGPEADSARPVKQLVEQIVKSWGEGSWEDQRDPNARHEATLLKLAIDKASAMLSWQPRWSFEECVTHTVEWYRAQAKGASAAELRKLTLEQIASYEGRA